MNKLIIIYYGEKLNIDDRRKKLDLYFTNPITAIIVNGSLIIEQTINYK